MKVNVIHVGLMLLSAWLVSCTSTDVECQNLSQERDVKTVKVIARNFEKADAISRTSVTIQEDGTSFAWAENDTIGIFPNTGYQVAFPMQSGAGAQVAEFDGGGWALRSTSQYAAYYPYHTDNRSLENIAITYLGQLQDGAKNTEHLGAYDYMATARIVPEDEMVTFEFEHLGVLLQWRMKTSSVHNLTSLTIHSNDSVLIKTGKLNLKNRKLAIEPIELGTELSMSLNGITTSSTEKEYIVYMMMAPVDLSGKEFSVEVADNSGYSATVSLEGQNFEAGKVYTLSADLTDFVEMKLPIDDYRGKVVSMEGDQITLEAFSGARSQYVISENAKEWISMVSNMSSNANSYVVRVHANPSDSTRRGLVTIKNMITGRAIEYAILQSGKKGYAVTENNGRIPIGVLTCNYEPTSDEHGLAMLVDKNLDTYFEAATQSELYLDWEGPYPVPIESVEYGRVAGECGMSGMTFHVATDGTDFHGLGWSVGFGMADGNYLSDETVNCYNRFYRLIATENNGGPTMRVSEFGLTVNSNYVPEE